MFMRIDRLQAERPQPRKPDPNAAATLQEPPGSTCCAFAPDYTREEIFEIASKRYTKRR